MTVEQRIAAFKEQVDHGRVSRQSLHDDFYVLYDEYRHWKAKAEFKDALQKDAEAPESPLEDP